ncbi:MAG: hypothetical protein MUO31_02230 [Thermodesulfovibrionales bacterium]|nr:hypothetical protein [Thermodesulfovibrionales bacterium]
MNVEQLNQLATICGIFLIIWELIKKHMAGTVFSILALLPLVFVEAKVYLLFTIIMTLPVVFEERWNKRSQKDMMRSVLAAGVIACTVAMITHS